MCGNGKLWTFGTDANMQPYIYSITSPTPVKTTQTPVTVVELTAGSEGAFFMGPTPGPTFAPDVVHMDPNGNVMWTIPRGTNPSFDSSVPAGSVPQMTAVTGKVFVKIGSVSGDDIFAFESTTHALGTPGKIVVDQPADSRFAMTDGTALYMFDPDSSTFYEIDTTTFAVKRTLDTGSSTYILNPLVAAGAAWLGLICNNETYIRRVDLATFVIADIPFPDAQATAPAGYAYLPP